jgi:hypothetical protein
MNKAVIVDHDESHMVAERLNLGTRGHSPTGPL